MKTCSKCLENKPITEFTVRPDRPGKVYSHCKACQRSYQRQNYRRNKEGYAKRRDANRERSHRIVADYLSSHPCVSCGEGDLRCLDFDHIKGEKVRSISRAIHCCWSKDRLFEEINKCVVRCSNCHRKRTSAKGNWYRHRYQSG